MIGCDWLNARPFWYCGNVGPLALEPAINDQIDVFRHAAAHFNLLGVCGIDVVIRGGDVYLIEINPRHTASAELYERYWPDLSMFKLHTDPVPSSVRHLGQTVMRDKCFGKAVWHTPYPCRAMYDPQELPPDIYADLPHHGQEFAAREPFVTIFAQALDREAVIGKLRHLAAGIPRRFKLERL